MKEFLLYGHGGAYNHGAEAIVRKTVDILKKQFPNSKIILSTHFKEQDVEFGLPIDMYCERDMDYVNKIKTTSEDSQYELYQLIYKEALDQIHGNTICLSVGGDNYSYSNWQKWKVFHDKAKEVGAKNILWSCSIEPNLIDDKMLALLREHDLITSRETLTYNALINKGLENVRMCADVAFLLEKKETVIPEKFMKSNAIALNISPLVLRKDNDDKIIKKNVYNLISYILKNTSYNIFLVPHVVIHVDNDFEALSEIADEFNSSRIWNVSSDLSASEYKYIISKCDLGVYARTHATIASYSSLVPTIAIGYSIKAQGIAKDLGMSKFVLPISEIIDETKLTTMFKLLVNEKDEVKEILSKIIPTYSLKANVKI